jgi:hypothetical protein
VPAGRWHVLTVEHTGDRIACSLDGKRQPEAKEDTFPKAGPVGLWTKADSQTYFDDLQVFRGVPAQGCRPAPQSPARPATPSPPPAPGRAPSP